jgi:hypothetical protein
MGNGVGCGAIVKKSMEEVEVLGCSYSGMALFNIVLCKCYRSVSGRRGRKTLYHLRNRYASVALEAETQLHSAPDFRSAGCSSNSFLISAAGTAIAAVQRTTAAACQTLRDSKSADEENEGPPEDSVHHRVFDTFAIMRASSIWRSLIWTAGATGR